MVKHLLLCSVCAGLLSGCFQANTSQAPIASTYPLTEQQKMQAAHHWDVLAEYEAKMISKSLSAYTKPLHVLGSDTTTPFSRGFKSLLTSQLVKQGSHVKATPLGAATVSYDVEVVEHKSRDVVRAPIGTWTALAAGVAVAIHAADQWSEPAKLLIPAAVGTDLFSGNWVDETNFEVIVTTRVVQNDQILHSSSNIYYINGGDADHYTPPAKAKSIRVTGEG